MLSDFLRLIKGFVLVIGPREAGKTSILRRLVTGKFEEQEPTIGFREEQIKRLRILEIGGHHNFKDYWKVALERDPLHTFYVIDVTHETEFNEYLQFLNENQDSAEKTTLIANKTDLTAEVPLHLHEMKSVIYSSAKNGEGMFDILESIARLQKEK
ncbi:MAG: hypothetical protein JSV04_04575 [Candidatus Heimdallarchaeota archaeon]|nr:MAG: hypothetical protein JSV04_04575 [Candidatus Heimdallarchaeota archaeon]